MQINKHGSFYIRNGWPTKAIDAIQKDDHIYSPNNELLAVDTIGVGRVMIKSMRYWATVLGLATEGKDQQGICHALTPLGQLIAENDIYCTDVGTLWLLHRNLAINEDEATAWYWAFNVLADTEFDKNTFSDSFYSYLQREGASYASKAVAKEFDCFKNTYVSEQAFSLSKVLEEDTIPFFAPLHLIEYKGRGVFEKRKLTAQEIPGDIFLYPGFKLVLPFIFQLVKLFLHLPDLGLIYLGGKVSFGAQFIQFQNGCVDLSNLLADLHRCFIIPLVLLGSMSFGKNELSSALLCADTRTLQDGS